MISPVLKIKGILSNKNIFPKMASLVLAIILWAVISSSKSSEIKIRIPIVIKNLPSDMAVSEISDKSVLILMEGRKDNMKNITVKNITAVVNLENPRVGKLMVYPIEIIKSDIPINIRIEPLKKEVKILIERVISKNVKINPVITGIVREGMTVGNIKVYPEFIMVRGSKSVVEKITEIKTESISIDNKEEDVIRDAEIEKDPKYDVTYGDSNVKVFVPIFDMNSLYNLTIPVSLRGTRKNYEYLLDQLSIKIKIKSVKKNILESDIVAYVDAGIINLPNEVKKDFVLKKELSVIIMFKGNFDGMEILSAVPEKIMCKVTGK